MTSVKVSALVYTCRQCSANTRQEDMCVCECGNMICMRCMCDYYIRKETLYERATRGILYGTCGQCWMNIEKDYIAKLPLEDLPLLITAKWLSAQSKEVVTRRLEGL